MHKECKREAGTKLSTVIKQDNITGLQSIGSKHFRVNATDTPVFKMPSRICRSIEAMKAQIYSPKNIIKMTKLEMASELLPLIEKAHKKGVDIDFDYHKRHFEIWHFKHDESDSFVKFIIERKRDFDKAINYIKSL